MTISEFIKKNRRELDKAIIKRLTQYDPPGFKRHIELNDEARRQWIMNDESLYNWARSEMVPI